LSALSPKTLLSRLPAALRALLLAAPLHGALLAVAVFFYEVRQAADLEVMGVRDDAVKGTVLAMFGADIIRGQVRILALYLVLGSLLGLGATALGRLWDCGRGTTPSRWLRVLRSLGLIVGFHSLMVARGIILYPQLYSEWLYDKGGLGRSLQVALTHHVPLWLLETVFLGALLAGILIPAWRLLERRGLVARARTRLAALAPRSRDRRVWIGALVLISALAATALVVARPARAPARGPNVLFIAVDSLRADRVGPQAAHVAPTLADLARRGTHYRSAFVTLPRTFPSWCSLLTSRYPNHHGIRTMFPSWEERARVKGALPELLRQQGWRTAVVSDFAGEIFTRIDLGFDTVRAPVFKFVDILDQRGLKIHQGAMPYLANPRGHRLMPAMAGLAENADPEWLTDTAIQSLRDVARGERFFLTVFYSATHYPYASRDPYYRKFADPSYRGPFLYQKPISLDTANPNPADQRQIPALYNGAVAATDHAIARLLAELKRLGLSERTIIVLTADHGENLLEEGRGMSHGEHLRGDKALRVPLVIYDPIHRPAPRAIEAITRDVDVAPTLAALLGVAPPARADGVDLGPLARGEKTDLDLRAYHETGLWMLPEGPFHGPGERIPYPRVTMASDLDKEHGYDIVLKPGLRDLVNVAKHRAIRTRDYKLIYIPLREGVRYQLFDLRADPEERTDVAAQHPEVVRELRENLLAWMLSEPGVTMRRDFILPVP
jgi:arylsulfatase A-like enzyme